MNTNVFGLKISTEYEYEYIRKQRYSNILEYFRIHLTPTLKTMTTTAKRWRNRRMCPLENHRNSELPLPPLPLTGLDASLYIGFDAVKLYFQVSCKANIISILS